MEYETLTGPEIAKAIAGEQLHRGAAADHTPTGDTPSVTAIPKTKPRPKPSADGGLEPEPSS